MDQLSNITRNRTKRLLVWAFDAASVLLVGVLLLLATVEPAFAYVDPSVMTYTIQAVAGVAVALGAVAGVALRRTRKWLFKALKIDENANKAKEDRLCRLSPEDAAALDETTPVYTERFTIRDNKELGWKSRFGIAFLVVLSCGFTLGISAPLELVAGNASNLTYGLADVWPVMACTTIVATVVLSLLISFLRGVAFRTVTLLLCCISICMYVQSLFMNGGLILNDNQQINWVGSFLPIMVVSTIVWLAILIVPQVLERKYQRSVRSGVIVVSICMIIVQAVGVGSLFFGNSVAEDSIGKSDITQKGLFEVSDKSNVIYLIVDHLDEHELEKLVGENPHLLDFLPNATVYTNAMETMTPTEFALPYMVTAVVPEVDEDINGSYLRRRYLEGTFLDAMAKTGYEVGVYTDSLRLNHLSNEEVWGSVGRYTENIHPTESRYLSWTGTLKILARASLYRNLPWVLKPPFLYTTSDLNDYMVARSEAESDADDQPYVIDDIAFYHKLLEKGLSIGGCEKGSFRFIHFDGNHMPWTKNENVEEVEHSDGGRDADAIGSLKVVEAYIQELKKLGVYDKSVIIITADHGDWETHTLPEHESVPILIVKPKTDGSAQNAPIYSDAPVGHEDLFATILEAMGAEGSRYGSTVSEVEAQFEANPNARTRETYMAAANEGYTKIIDLFLFTVQGNAKNWEDWTYTGITWHVEDES